MKRKSSKCPYCYREFSLREKIIKFLRPRITISLSELHNNFPEYDYKGIHRHIKNLEKEGFLELRQEKKKQGKPIFIKFKPIRESRKESVEKEILKEISIKPISITGLSKKIKINRSTLRHYLRLLKREGLIESERQEHVPGRPTLIKLKGKK